MDGDPVIRRGRGGLPKLDDTHINFAIELVQAFLAGDRPGITLITDDETVGDRERAAGLLYVAQQLAPNRRDCLVIQVGSSADRVEAAQSYLANALLTEPQMLAEFPDRLCHAVIGALAFACAAGARELHTDPAAALRRMIR
jgi:hypothetical protein